MIELIRNLRSLAPRRAKLIKISSTETQGEQPIIVDYVREAELLREAAADDDGIRGLIAASLAREFDERSLERIIPIVSAMGPTERPTTFE